jgi:hypothetical protein
MSLNRYPAFAPFRWSVLLFILFSDGVKSQDSLLLREPVTLSVSGGAYSILDMWAITGYADIRVIPPWKVWVLRPQAGSSPPSTDLAWPTRD